MEYIKEYLGKLKNLDESMFLNGAAYHQYMLHPVLEQSTISLFQQKYTVALPTQYEKFLTCIGDGGAGPSYGLYSFAKSIEMCSQKRWKLSENSMLTRDSYGFIPGLDTEENLIWMFNGCIPIADTTDGFFFLILSGKKKGQVWRYEYQKGVIEQVANSFLTWYEEWLSLCLTAGVIAEIKNHLMMYGELETISFKYTAIREYFEEKCLDCSDTWMLNLLLPLGEIHAYEALGWLYLSEQDFEDAYMHFQNLYLCIDEKMKAAGGHGLWAIHILQGQVFEALKIGEVAITLSKYCLDIERIYELQYALSLTYTVVGKSENALKAAEELIDIFPIDTSFQVLASLYVKFDDKKLAKQSISRLVKSNVSKKFYYGRKFWHIYQNMNEQNWSHWIAQISGCKSVKKTLQKTKGKQETLKRILQEKYSAISQFCYKAIDSVSYIDDLNALIQFALDNESLLEFEIYLLQLASTNRV